MLQLMSNLMSTQHRLLVRPPAAVQTAMGGSAAALAAVAMGGAVAGGARGMANWRDLLHPPRGAGGEGDLDPLESAEMMMQSLFRGRPAPWSHAANRALATGESLVSTVP